jgi:segregation and condensation protein B
MPVKPNAASEPPQQGISLDELSAAFAQAIGRQPDSAEAQGPESREPSAVTGRLATEPAADSDTAAQGQAGLTALPTADEIASAAGDDSGPVTPLGILEAMLFVGNQANRPLEPAEAAQGMRGVELGEIPGMVDELNRRYATAGCPYEIVSQDAGYRMLLRKELHSLRGKLFGRIREAWLSQAAIDVLAIVAYRQPVFADDISRLRGTPSGHILQSLVRRQLLRIERAAEKPRKACYYTTERFLKLYGLESLADLPQSDDLDGR